MIAKLGPKHRNIGSWLTLMGLGIKMDDTNIQREEFMRAPALCHNALGWNIVCQHNALGWNIAPLVEGKGGKDRKEGRKVRVSEYTTMYIL